MFKYLFVNAEMTIFAEQRPERSTTNFETNTTMPQYNYIAIARNGAGLIAKGDRITFTSERQVEESTGLSFRHEIAEAVRQQLHADVDPSQEAQTATNFDVYSESRYAEVREKLEAAAAREQAAEEKRKRAEEREQAKAEREAQRAEKQSSNGKKNSNNGRIGQNGGTTKTKKKTTRKKGISLGPLGKIKLKSLLKFLVAAVAVIWFVSTNLKSCSLQSILEEIGVNTEQTTTKKKSTTKKSTTATKKSTTSSSAARKSSSTTSTKKSTSSTSKKSSTSSSTRKSSTTKSSAKKKSTSSSSKKSTTKRKTSRN